MISLSCLTCLTFAHIAETEVNLFEFRSFLLQRYAGRCRVLCYCTSWL